MKIKNRLALLTPPYDSAERGGKLAVASADLPSFALLTLAGFVREKGFEVRICDASAELLTFEQTLNWIVDSNPTIVGFSATTPSITRTAKLAQRLKEIKPEVLILLGGPHATAVPQETISRFSAFDALVIGEGEETLAEVLSLYPDDAWKNVDGLCLRNKEADIGLTSPRNLIVDLDSLPYPAWDLLPHFPHKYHPAAFKSRSFPAAQYLTARGCPYRCVFCDTSVFSHRIRYHSAEYVLGALSILYHRFGVREISFEDDTLTMNNERLIKICEGMLQRNLRFTWTCNGRVNNVKSEILKLMKRAGCWQIAFGIESGCQEILDLARKGIKLGQIRRALGMTKKAGIRTRGYFIIGFPTESEATLRRTLDFALSLPLDDISVMLMTPFPGSEMHRIAPQYGVLLDDWEKMNMLNTVFIPHGFSKQKLDQWHRRFILEFYLQPKNILKNIGRVVYRPNLIPRYVKSAFAVVKSQ